MFMFLRREPPKLCTRKPPPAFCLYPSSAYPLNIFLHQPSPRILSSLPLSGIHPSIFFFATSPPRFVFSTPLRHTTLIFFREPPIPHFVFFTPLRQPPPLNFFYPPRICSSLSLSGIPHPLRMELTDVAHTIKQRAHNYLILRGSRGFCRKILLTSKIL